MTAATHMDRGDGRTLCGRDASKVALINPSRDCIEDATCKACGHVDDARSARTYRAECRAAGVEP